MGWSAARFVLTTGLLSGVMLFAAACGSGDSLDAVERAKEEGRQEAIAEQKAAAEEKRQADLEAKVKRLEKQQKAQKAAAAAKKKEAASAPSASTGTSCGSGISVGPNTTCAFARNVYLTWHGAGGGSIPVEVWSPVTERYYTMHCTAGGVTTCRGGNNAVVYIR